MRRNSNWHYEESWKESMLDGPSNQWIHATSGGTIRREWFKFIDWFPWALFNRWIEGSFSSPYFYDMVVDQDVNQNREMEFRWVALVKFRQKGESKKDESYVS